MQFVLSFTRDAKDKDTQNPRNPCNPRQSAIQMNMQKKQLTKHYQDFRDALLTWFKQYQREMPWRNTDDPYRIWVSEVMLQQTQVVKVIDYYEKFIARFPSVRDLAAAPLQDVLKVWEGLGYYARARNLHKAAQVIVNELDGEIPLDYTTFRKLPGVGDYSAAAVQSIAFNAPYAAVDGNIKRVLARLLLLVAPLNDDTMRQDEFPKRRESKPTPEHHLAVGVIYNSANEVLITQRQLDGLLGGLWEFPGGKIAGGEAAEAACVRNIAEVVNLSVKNMRYLTRVRHAFTHFKIVVDVFQCDYEAGEVVLNGPRDAKWVALATLQDYPLPRATHKFLDEL